MILQLLKSFCINHKESCVAIFSKDVALVRYTENGIRRGKTIPMTKYKSIEHLSKTALIQELFT